MPYHYWWGSGMWFFPLFFLSVFAICLVFFLMGKRGCGPWRNQERGRDGTADGETALDILKKRYAKGEISKEEFEQIKKDISSY